MVSPLLSSDPRGLGPYWLAGRLGAGGQGVVYEGYDAGGARVAVKALHADQITDAYRDQLRREVAALGRVASFCTARIIEADLDHLPPYLVSEYVPGPDLQSWVERNGAYGPGELFRLAIGIATALTSIHQAGVVHRDLKPANVLLGPDGPRVIDFGIARTEEMSRSATGMKGTPRWMAPEVFQGERATAAVDVWAWGAVVLYAATGKFPFDGESLPSLIYQIVNTEPDLDALPSSLLPLVERALSRDPAARPTARGLLDALIGDAPLEEGKRAAAALPAAALAPSPAEAAEAAYTGLDPEAREAVPRVLLRMVATTPEDFRTVVFPELLDGETTEPAVRRVVAALAGAGILRQEEERVSLAAPALLRAWPRLRDWAETDRPVLDAHRALADAARRWDGHGRKNADLLHGSSLDEAITGAVAGRRHLTLNLLERSFLDGSVLASRRRTRNRGFLATALAVLLVVASGTAATSLKQGRTLAAKNETVTRQRDDAIGAQVANLAISLRRIDPVKARRLAVAAGDIAPGSADTRNALVTLNGQWEEDIYRPPGVEDALSWTTDGPARLLAYAWADRVKIFDVDTRAQVGEFAVPGSPVKRPLLGGSLTLSGDGKRLGVYHEDGTVTFHDVATGTPAPVTIRLPEPYLQLDQDGTRLLTIEAKHTRVHDVATGAVLLDVPYAFDVVDLSRRGYLVGTRGPSLEVWEVKSRSRVKLPKFEIPKKKIDNLAISPAGNALALVQGDQVRHLRLDKGLTTVRTVPKTPFTSAPVYSSDGRYLLLNGMIWDIEHYQQHPVFRYGIGQCTRQTFGPGDRSVRCVDGERRINVISLATIQDTVRLDDTAFSSSTVTLLSADGSTLVTQSRHTLDVFDPLTRKKRGSLPFDLLREGGGNLVLSPDGATLAETHQDGRIDLWDVRSAAKRSTLATGRTLVKETPMAFSPDARTLAFLTGDTDQTSLLDLWDVPSGRLRATSKGEPPAGGSRPIAGNLYDHPKVLFSPDGRTVVSAQDQGVVEVATGKRLVPAAHGLESAQALSAQGVVAEPNTENVRFWDAATLRQRSEIRPGGTPGPSMAFSRDGSLLAISDTTAQIRLWDMKGNRLLGLPLTGRHVPKSTTPNDTASSIAFAPDGSAVFSIDREGLLRTHLIDPVKISASFCARLGPLSREDWKTYVPASIGYRSTC
ncbi:WD40 repeat domain-containing serine/threonine protein kinase [Actinocorallia longicatena]|uniref:Protein kinase domain-containing protein n=1 Tax=Actinocorallia longicatena TaxID=111803 RepID=A0ABP6Q8Q0_9ACTN